MDAVLFMFPGLVDDEDHTALVMEYYKRGTLAGAMRSSAYQELTTAERVRMALQVGTCVMTNMNANPIPFV